MGLQKGPLNKAESIGLCQRILQFRPNEGKSKIEKFLKEQKLTNSEELGDLLARHDITTDLFENIPTDKKYKWAISLSSPSDTVKIDELSFEDKKMENEEKEIDINQALKYTVSR